VQETDTLRLSSVSVDLRFIAPIKVRLRVNVVKPPPRPFLRSLPGLYTIWATVLEHRRPFARSECVGSPSLIGLLSGPNRQAGLSGHSLYLEWYR
jgi:hypothetical protein